eukprot:scaffold10285_cov105-Isochrysis_galbana.AAC.6
MGILESARLRPKKYNQPPIAHRDVHAHRVPGGVQHGLCLVGVHHHPLQHGQRLDREGLPPLDQSDERRVHVVVRHDLEQLGEVPRVPERCEAQSRV